MSDPLALRIAIVAEHASAKFGGEAALPLHYFRVLRERGADVWLVVHARTRPELSSLFPGEQRIRYIEDSRFHIWMWRLGHYIPRRIEYFTTAFALRLATQLEQRRIVKRLVAEERVNIVHQPMPVSPKEPTMMFGFGVPVVVGPMNGGIDFPPAFARYQSRFVSAVLALGRKSSYLMNRLIPGKLRSDVLLVANERTRRALPGGIRGEVIELVENGVDLKLWRSTAGASKALAGQTNFLFMGRLVDWKAVDLLLAAFRDVQAKAPASLTILGDGPERARLEAMCTQWEILGDEGAQVQVGKVYFAGWKPQSECAEILERSSVLVLPSLMECGGAVVLEAMAASRPVIATDWGGPADYLDPSCGILVKPTSSQAMIDQLTDSMLKLANSPELRDEMGHAGREKVLRLFDWEVKVDVVTGIYTRLIATSDR